MIIELIDIEKKNTDLTPKKKYTVISIDGIKSTEGLFNLKFRIVNDNGIAALYDYQIFEIVEPKLDSDFVFNKNSHGNFELIPESMNYSAFWVNFFDDEENALAIFKKRFEQEGKRIF